MVPLRTPLPGADALLGKLREFCLPWRQLTLAIDGRNGAGKSSLARYLGWRLGIPVVETDLWMTSDSPIMHDIPAILTPVRSRHEGNRPVIVEGVALLHTLELAGLQQDFLVMVTNLADEQDHDGRTNYPRNFSCLSTDVQAYLDAYRPRDRADFHLCWS